MNSTTTRTTQPRRIRGAVLKAPPRNSAFTGRHNSTRQTSTSLSPPRNSAFTGRHNSTRQTPTSLSPPRNSAFTGRHNSTRQTSTSLSTSKLRMLEKRMVFLHSFLPKEIMSKVKHTWSASSSKTTNQTYSNVSYDSNATLDSMQSHGSSSKALYSAEAHNVSIVLINIVGFSKISKELPPSDVANMLQDLFHRFEKVCEHHNLLKLDTIGDAFLFFSPVGCLSEEHQYDNHDEDNDGFRSASLALAAAKDMIREARKVPIPSTTTRSDDACSSNIPSSQHHQEYVSVRVGIHTGDTTFVSVLSQSLPNLTCIGETVSMAARMKQTAQPNTIHVTKVFRDLVGDFDNTWGEDCESVDTYSLKPLNRRRHGCRSILGKQPSDKTFFNDE